MDPLVSAFKASCQSVLDQLKEELKTIRTGRANPSIIENLLVQTYGGQTTLKLRELSSITTEGPLAIVIQPFDPSTAADIEKAILKSPLGFSPQTQSNRLIIRMPPMSQEGREKMIKLVGQKIEEKRNSIRFHRDETRKKIKTGFEAKTLTEDDKFRLESEVDKEASAAMDEIAAVKERKETEILEV